MKKRSCWSVSSLALVGLMLSACGGDGGSQGPVSEEGRLAGFTAAHNEVRAQVGVSDITWDEELAGVAQAYADKLAGDGCKLKHSSNGYGENLYAASGIDSTAEAVVQAWASEEADYNYADNSCSGVCGHYTQVVWENSSKLGCGMANCGNNGEVWVCNYDPPGNYVGQKPY